MVDYSRRLVQIAGGYPGVVMAQATDSNASSMFNSDTVHPYDEGLLCLARAAAWMRK